MKPETRMPDREGLPHMDRSLYDAEPNRQNIKPAPPKKRDHRDPDQKKINEEGLAALRAVLKKSEGKK